MARLHLSEECHQSGQLRKCHHSRQVGFHLARTHVILTLPRPPPFFNTTPEKCHRNGHSLTVHLLRYSDTKDLKMPLSTKYRRQLAPSFMGANYMSKSHVTVVGAVAEGKTCQRSSLSPAFLPNTSREDSPGHGGTSNTSLQSDFKWKTEFLWHQISARQPNTPVYSLVISGKQTPAM